MFYILGVFFSAVYVALRIYKDGVKRGKSLKQVNWVQALLLVVLGWFGLGFILGADYAQGDGIFG